MADSRRRKEAPGSRVEFTIDSYQQRAQSEKVVHRRVRTGCYTCRERRVKCDETRPICNKCRRAERACEFSALLPTPPSEEIVPQARDREEPVVEDNLNTQKPRFAGTTSSAELLIRQEEVHDSKWDSLSPDAKMHLTYFQKEMSCCHFGIWLDPEDFFKTNLLHLAMTEESTALIYAIIALASFYTTFLNQEKNMEGFLPFYDRSISQVHRSLQKGKQSPATCLATLILAVLEQNIGDWLRVLSHQRGAHMMLTKLYTPETIVQDETGRTILRWHIQIDLFAGVLGGVAPELEWIWYETLVDVLKQEARDKPQDRKAQFGNLWASIVFVMAECLHTLSQKKDLSDDEFDTLTSKHLNDFVGVRKMVEESFADKASYVKVFTKEPTSPVKDIVEYRDPEFVYDGDLFTKNYALLFAWTVDTVLKGQIIAHRPIKALEWGPHMWQTSLNVCKMHEAMAHCEQSPPGTWKVTCAYMAGTSFILGRDQRNADWYCHRLAEAEKLGLIPVPKFRMGLSELWGRDLTRWWLPDENAPELVLDIREFVQGRDMPWADAMSTQVNEAEGIFSSLSLD